MRRTKIVATLGPASSSPEMIRMLILAGMDVARLNFSHGDFAVHAKVVENLRTISHELDRPVTILQDLQGPKIRVGKLPEAGVLLEAGETIVLAPENDPGHSPGLIPIDYPHLASEAKPGMQVLMADGLFELTIKEISGERVACTVVEGGVLMSRKGVNFPDLKLRLPSLTDKDIRDLEYGLKLDVDWISLSFVRSAEDVRFLKNLLAEKGSMKPVIAKIEKPQAIEHLEEIVEEAHGIMVARGDLGVEMNPEKVPMLQKRIIELCNRKGKPVITATQMLESMIHDPRPTRAEASDVANAIIDGTDAVMLSGETAMGAFPVKAVEMMNRIAQDVESRIDFKTYPPEGNTNIQALGESASTIAGIIDPRCIALLTTSGRSARYMSAERPKVPVYALTTHLQVYHALNLIWGVVPLFIHDRPETVEEMAAVIEQHLVFRRLACAGDRILIMAGIPAHQPGGTNFLMIRTLGSYNAGNAATAGK